MKMAVIKQLQSFPKTQLRVRNVPWLFFDWSGGWKFESQGVLIWKAVLQSIFVFVYLVKWTCSSSRLTGLLGFYGNVEILHELKLQFNLNELKRLLISLWTGIVGQNWKWQCRDLAFKDLRTDHKLSGFFICVLSYRSASDFCDIFCDIFWQKML